MKKLLCVLILFCCMMSIVVAQQKKEPAQIPILGWYGVSPKDNTVERFKEQKESGITHNFTFYKNAEELATALDAAQKAGIKVIAHCPELEKEPEKTVKRFMNHPALAGYFLRDEPGRADFPELGAWAKRIQKVDNSHFCYLNLFPVYAPPAALGTDTYREYVQQFIEEVPLQLLSFDHYPIILDETGNRIVRNGWYENLEIFSEEAAKAGKPFWAFALTVAHASYPIPTIEEIRLQVFSNLAYGAQGIQYFTYWTPGTDEGFDFHHGPIDHDTRKRTEVFDRIKEMNREIRNLSKVFLNAKVVSIAHTGDIIPDGTKRQAKLPDVIKMFETEGEGAIVSILEKGNDSFLVIVNRDFKKSMKVRIEGDHSLQRVLKDGTVVPARAYINTLEVDPADLLIYNWKK
ncbi:beta-galactosidase [Proteiniphilum sp.]|nr:beta-galactosidase [Proteiniphilum sp.]MEA4916101.1 beta-galactosidase [Proteiniphilum sp.]